MAGKHKPDDAWRRIIPNKAKIQRLSCEIMLTRRLLRRMNHSGIFMVRKSIDSRRKAVEYLKEHDAPVSWAKLYKKFRFAGYTRSKCKTTKHLRTRIQELNSALQQNSTKNACDAR